MVFNFYFVFQQKLGNYKNCNDELNSIEDKNMELSD